MKKLNKNTDCYILALWMERYKSITEHDALHGLGIKNLSARISDLRHIGLPLDSILKKITKKSNGKVVKVRDRYEIRKGKVGVYRARFKELTKGCGE